VSYKICFKLMIVVLLGISCWPAAVLGQGASATVTIVDYPPSVITGQTFQVDVGYTANLADFGYRGRIYLDIIDASNGSVLDHLCDDNSGQGYEGPSGTISFTSQLTSELEIYFLTYVAPMEFNQCFVDEYQSYPTDGTHSYDSVGNGVTHDIVYQGKMILKNDSDTACHDRGITFEVFMDAYQTYNESQGLTKIGGMGLEEMSEFRWKWFGEDGNPKRSVNAITSSNLGYEITDQEKVMEGDQVQLWDNFGNGTAGIFVGWEREGETITGIRYWSSRMATNGIAISTGYFNPDDLDAGQCYYERVLKPAAPDDWANRYSDDTTSPNVTIVMPPPTPTPTPTPPVGVAIVDYPTTVSVGQTFQVDVDYNANLWEMGYRGRIYLDIIDASDGSILDHLCDDNSGQGYEGPTGTVSFTSQMMSALQMYFLAYIAPMEFNQWFVDKYQRYPTDGTYPYDPAGNGVTHDILYQGETILKNDSDTACHDRGITFEVFMDGYETYNESQGLTDIGGMGLEEMYAFQSKWFGEDDNPKRAVNAITFSKLGYEITDQEKVMEGDQVQLWDNFGNGTAGIFVGWEREGETITGIRYWSSRMITNGIAISMGYFSPDDLDAGQCYYARVLKPAAPDDWANRYWDDTTSPNLTLVIPTPTPSPTPTPTPSPTPTPTPSPTPMGFPIREYNFSEGTEGWSSGSVPDRFTPPLFSSENGMLSLTSKDNKLRGTFGYWVSPVTAVPLNPDYVYNAQFLLTSSIDDGSSVPQIRLRFNDQSFQESDFLVIESALDGGFSPTQGSVVTRDLFFSPCVSGDGALSFDILNFNPLDAEFATVSLDEVVVRRYLVSELTGKRTEYSWDFIESDEDWTFGGAPAAFTLPVSGWAGSSLILMSMTNTNCFGFWGSPFTKVNIAANRLYRGRFEIRTDVASRTDVPEIRVRLMTENGQAVGVVDIRSVGDASAAPHGYDNTPYYVYFYPPQNAVGTDRDGMAAAIDLLNFDPTDDALGMLMLDRVVIESYDRPPEP
jgi:hypothetical protein